MSPTRRSSIRSSIRRHLIWGLAVVLVLVGGVGGWAATTEISGAVIAQGQVVVQTSLKDVQHPSGGVVAEILARDGDLVDAGEVLVRLDGTLTRANLALVERTLIELHALRARLAAERDGEEQIPVPEELKDRVDEPTVANALAGEGRLFELRRATREGQKAQLRERIEQLEQEIVGISAQQEAKAREAALLQSQVDSATEMTERGLMPTVELTRLQREAARLDGETAQLTSSVARGRGQISEIELQIIQIDREFASEVAMALRETDGRLGEFVERRIAAQDQLNRTDIRAPLDGQVHQSTVHTIGGVISAGEVIMQIVPLGEGLEVEAKILPDRIDQIAPGQPAQLRFSAFNQQTTPELSGTITRISADVTLDQRLGIGFYTVRVGLLPGEIERLGGAILVPGMPVEVFITAEDRNVLSYLLKPLEDQSRRAFREE